ncbi:MAG: hypothetical protein V7687_16795 [Maribacter arcticus]|uniref:hypothetical protein n=1 Tax=Maribacter arcticus TaxID=561365 RepID=UPI00300274B2
MKIKLLTLLLSLTALIGCTASDDDSAEFIFTEKYGVYVKSDSDIKFNYVFKNFETGEIFHQGNATTSTNEVIMFDVTDKEIEAGEFIILEVRADSNKNISVYYQAKSSDSYYRDSVTNANPDSLIELNSATFIESENHFEAAIPLKYFESNWISRL